jgi:mono/diheme cytochrome c family protein
MRSFLASFAVLMALAVIGGLAFIYSGLFDVAASEPHWSITRWVLETARKQSIKVHAAGIEVPPGLDEPSRLLIGTEHFAAHCAVCHGAPGVPKGDIGQGLSPQPPNLAHSSEHYTSSELFWIIKHGIRMTGMPAWGDHSDDELWATVAFLRKLPEMTPEDYAKLVMQVVSHGGQHYPAAHNAHPEPGTGQPRDGAAHDHVPSHDH